MLVGPVLPVLAIARSPGWRVLSETKNVSHYAYLICFQTRVSGTAREEAGRCPRDATDQALYRAFWIKTS